MEDDEEVHYHNCWNIRKTKQCSSVMWSSWSILFLVCEFYLLHPCSRIFFVHGCWENATLFEIQTGGGGCCVVIAIFPLQYIYSVWHRSRRMICSSISTRMCVVCTNVVWFINLIMFYYAMVNNNGVCYAVFFFKNSIKTDSLFFVDGKGNFSLAMFTVQILFHQTSCYIF